MPRGTIDESRKTYVDSLRWRRGDLQDKIADLQERLQSLTKEEGGLRQELRAVEQLLFAVDGAANGANASRPAGKTEKSPEAGTRTEDATKPSLDFGDYGPIARRIYASAEQAIREAGVPLHYRVLAEEVQKQIPLSGKDPGATLIAHLHRAQDLFPRVGRGVYGLQGMTPAPGPDSDDQPATTTTRKRPRTRRRRTQ